MSVDPARIVFSYKIYDSLDALEDDSPEKLLTLKDKHVRDLTTGSRILDSTIWAIQFMISNKLGLDAETTRVIFYQSISNSFSISQIDFSCEYSSIRELTNSCVYSIGSELFPLRVKIYENCDSWITLREAMGEELHHPNTPKRFTF